MESSDVVWSLWRIINSSLSNIIRKDPHASLNVTLVARSTTFSRTKHQNKTAWITPSPEHHWYQCSRPGGSLAHGFTRQDQTLLAHPLKSGHIKSMKFSEGRNSFEMCMNSSSEPATPAHILECLGLTKQDLADVPLLVLDFLKSMMSWTWSSIADQWGRATTTTTTTF
ncbi:uncharacterized protein TNCV_2320861 [Trichonephila clavipes]|nr:uncharacterized protein TNCV_2320861 [Trichonephila clavipes]